MDSVAFPDKSDFRVVVIPPMWYAYTAFIDHDIDAMQGVVGGLVECLSTGIGQPDSNDRQIDFWCNDEFLYADDMVFNRVLTYANGYNQPIYGPMFACAATPYDGESCGLTFDEALSILEAPHVPSPHYLLPHSGGVTVQVVPDGAGRGFYDLLRDLPDYVKEQNNIPLDDEGFDRLMPAPLVGKPEDLLVGKWRIHMVYPGESLAGSTESYLRDAAEAESVGLGQPIVEFWDMSQNRKSFPKGQFVSSYYLGDLHLDNRSGIELDGGVAAWSIEGGDFEVARQFIEQTAEATARENARRACIEAKFPWEQARDAARVSQDSEAVEARGKRQGR